MAGKKNAIGEARSTHRGEERHM